MNTKVKSKKTLKTIWVGTVEDIFGYGMSVVAETENDCLKALKKAYKEWTDNDHRGYDDYGDQYDENGKKMTRFEKAMEHWGMDIKEVTLGKVYFDGFND